MIVLIFSLDHVNHEAATVKAVLREDLIDFVEVIADHFLVLQRDDIHLPRVDFSLILGIGIFIISQRGENVLETLEEAVVLVSSGPALAHLILGIFFHLCGGLQVRLLTSNFSNCIKLLPD